MFYRDLTPYSYFSPDQNALNVGWLSDQHRFPVGPTTPEFRRDLSELATEPVNLCMGSHDCEFCTPLFKGFFFWRRKPPKPNVVPSGNGEIRVPAIHGDCVYVAPVLAVHYVEAHNYLPPAEFVEAVKVFADVRRKAWADMRVQWAERFPPLDGQWTQWRLYSYGWLIVVACSDELPQAIQEVERYYRTGFAVSVSRSFNATGEEDVVVETTRHEISEGIENMAQFLADSYMPAMKKARSVPFKDYDSSCE